MAIAKCMYCPKKSALFGTCSECADKIINHRREFIVESECKVNDFKSMIRLLTILLGNRCGERDSTARIIKKALKLIGDKE